MNLALKYSWNRKRLHAWSPTYCKYRKRQREDRKKKRREKERMETVLVFIISLELLTP